MIPKIHIVDDKDIKNFSAYEIFDYSPDRNFNDEVVINAYDRESWGTWQYLYLFYWFDKHDIRVNWICPKNFFPIASRYSHRVYMYNTNIKKFVTDEKSSSIGGRKISSKLLKEVGKKCVWSFSPGKYSRVFKMGKHIFEGMPLQEGFLSITEDQIFDFYKERKTYILLSSYKDFLKVKPYIKKGSVWIEFSDSGLGRKLIGKVYDKIIKPHSHNLTFEIDKKSQKKLNILKNIFDYSYLTVQILSSIESKIKFIGLHGASKFFICSNVNCLYLEAGHNAEMLNIQNIRNSINLYWYNDVITPTFV